MNRFEEELKNLHREMSEEANPDYTPIPDEFFKPAMTMEEYYEEYPEKKPDEVLISISLE